MTRPGNVLVIGVALTDDPCSNVEHIAAELAGAGEWDVTQHWATIGSDRTVATRNATTENVPRAPKFTVLNRLLQRHRLHEYDHVLVCDDDILLPRGFLDRYLALVERHDLSLAQPARTHDSYIDHAFVRQLDGIDARRTRFVEIGPLFSVRRDACHLMLPFDVESPMGWGMDLVWPRQLEAAGLKLGIVDAAAVSHSLRKPVSGYNYALADRQMKEYLSRRPHLSWSDAFFIHESYA